MGGVREGGEKFTIADHRYVPYSSSERAIEWLGGYKGAKVMEFGGWGGDGRRRRVVVVQKSDARDGERMQVKRKKGLEGSGGV